MIYHVMKDGTVKKDISGHVVKREDVREVYQVLESVKVKSERKETA